MEYKKRNVAIDAYRGALILWICLFHYTFRYPNIYGENYPSFVFINGANVGVTFFFILAGYYFDNSMTKVHGVAEFVKKKCLRLLPEYFLCLTSTFLILLLFSDQLVSSLFIKYLLNLFLVSLDLEGATWYLRMLLILYFVFYFIYNTCTQKYLITILIVVLIALMVLLHVSGTMLYNPLSDNLLRSLFPFSIGVLLRQSCCQCSSNRLYGWRNIVILSFFVALICPMYYGVPGLFVMSIMLLYPRAHFLKFLSPFPLSFVGRISYPLYLIHQQVGFLLLKNGLEISITLIVVIVFAFFIHYLSNFIISFIEGQLA